MTSRPTHGAGGAPRSVRQAPPPPRRPRHGNADRFRRPRIAIVGAGPGGLAAALLLAHAGAEVTIVEAQSRVGGRSGVYASDGFRFDIGPTFFLYPRILEEIFAVCGLRLADEIDLIRLDPMYKLVFEGGGAIRASADLDVLAAEIASVSPDDAQGVFRLMAESRDKFCTIAPLLQRQFTGLMDYLRPDVLKALPTLRPFHSIDRDLSRYFADPRVRLAFSFQSKYLGMSPFRCPSLFSILSFMEYEYGVFHPRGGCGAVMEAMARCAIKAGARLHLDEPVRAIRFDGHRAVGVETANRYLPVDAVVINADFATAMRRLVPDRLRRRWSDQRIDRKRYSCSTFMMYLGIEGDLTPLEHHTIFLAEDYRANIDEIEAATATPQRPSLYIQNACVTDPGQAPPGCSTLYVLVPVGNLGGSIDWSREAARYRALVLARLGELGLRDLERRIRFEKIVTPVDWRDDMRIFRGATFNLAHDLSQMLHRRPHNRFEELDRVYLVGGGTQPGSGLPVIFESARIASRLLAADLGLDLPEAGRGAGRTVAPAAASM